MSKYKVGSTLSPNRTIFIKKNNLFEIITAVIIVSVTLIFTVTAIDMALNTLVG